MVTDPITEESGSIIILHNLESIKVFESLENWKTSRSHVVAQ